MMPINKVKDYFKDTPKKSKSYFKEYCEYSGIHGFRYIAESRTYCERLWWIISIGLSAIFCGVMIYQIITEYLNYPIIVTFSMQEMPIEEIPFPAVTICPSAKVSQDHFNITKVLSGNRTHETEKKFHMAKMICGMNLITPAYRPNDVFKENITADDLLDFLERTKINDFIGFVRYGKIYQYDANSSEEPCLVTPVLTQEGLCYSFNILDRENIYRDGISFTSTYQKVEDKSHWNIEEGYENSSLNIYPFRARKGMQDGLAILLKTKISDVTYHCSLFDSGYWMKIHSPSKIPQTIDSSIKLPLNQVVIGQITPHIIKTSPGVQAINPDKRGCYFQSERWLKYFKIYTQENCLLECRTNLTIQKYDCVQLYMPRFNDTPFCNSENIIYEDFEVTDFDLMRECGCLPSCTDLTYNTVFSQNPLTNVKVYKERIKEGYQAPLLLLHFTKSHIETRKRNTLYGYSDFVSNFGGLLGLFTGFSILSLIEIVYFLSLRIWGNIKLYKNWSGNSNNTDSIC